MSRSWIWLQVLLGWSPVWALFVALVLTGHPGATFLDAALIASRLILAAGALSFLVPLLARTLPWPHPMRPAFLAIQLAAAVVYAASWILLNSLIESMIHRELRFVVGIGVGPFLVLGAWLYVMVAGVIYAAQATARAARIEAAAAQSQLAALRAQLNPHFLFNALHTVVQLIPREPTRAAQAAEQLAGLLRTTIEEDRDLVSLAEEWAFVERYVDLERLRFGERLRIHVDLTEEARRAELPSFALQTLVENAIRHGAMPQVAPTDVDVRGFLSGNVLTLTVRDTGAGARLEDVASSTGTGLRRLRERLVALYGDRASLDIASGCDDGFTASLTIPQVQGEEV